MESLVSADGTEIAYEQTGSGPPLVRVHGGTADHTSWDPVRAAFEADFTVYLVDRRGRGQSGDADDYELEREFEDVTAVVDSVDEPVCLVGHSFGALCCLEAALRTDNLRKLVLYEPPFPVGGHQSHDVPEELLPELEALLAAGENEQVLELFLREVAAIPPAELDALRSTPAWQRSVDAAHTIRREVEAATDYEFDATRFEGLTTPTLLLVGSESSPHLRAATAAVDDALPNSRIATLEGQDHNAMLTAPDRYVDAVRSFLHDPA